jgi:hypothetical protein
LSVRKRYVAPIVAWVMLAVPASASAHARTPTVALDYRLVLDRATRSLPGVSVGILDGDRSLRLIARTTTVTVFGDLREPMLKVGPSGAFANRASATAVSQRLVSSGTGWERVGGSTFTWHDHRLAPPPYDGSRTGAVGRLRIPVVVGGREAALAGSFVRYRRPTPWPWLASALVGAAAAIGLARSVPERRRPLSVALGATSGVAAVASLASFNAADSPTGRVAWVELLLAGVVGAAALVAIVRADAERRTFVAGLVGAAAAATTLGSLAVFRHAVVIAALPPAAARAVCAVALAGGVAAAATGIVMRSRS